MAQPRTLSLEQAISEIDRIEKKHVLVGNGLSRSLLPGDEFFCYPSLYEKFQDKLSDFGRRLFKGGHESNFEKILHRLSSTLETLSLLDQKPAGILETIENEYSEIKRGLIKAVQEVHPTRKQVEPHVKRLEACGEFLKQFSNVFTTNYDLLLYWIRLEYLKNIFSDGFGKGDKYSKEFLGFESNERYFIFLHGALHLFTEYGAPKKAVWVEANPELLEQFSNRIENPQGGEYPLFVAEGTAEKKSQQIDENQYLRMAFDHFKNIDGTLVIFGMSLHSDQDSHVLHALSANRNLKSIYVGFHGSESDLNSPAGLEFQARVIRHWQVWKENDHILKKITKKAPNSLSFFLTTGADIWTPPEE